MSFILSGVHLGYAEHLTGWHSAACWKSRAPRASRHIRDFLFHLLKMHLACQEGGDHGGRRHEQDSGSLVTGSCDDHRKPSITPAIGFSRRADAISLAPASWAGIRNRRGEHPELEKRTK